MMIYMSPQFNESLKYTYFFEDECVSVLFGKDQFDNFDFSEFKTDGEVSVETIETTLPVNPILSAKRVDGKLYIEVLNFIDSNASEQDKFPKWEEVN